MTRGTHRARLTLAVVAGAILTLSACGSGGTESSAAPSAGRSEPNRQTKQSGGTVNDGQQALSVDHTGATDSDTGSDDTETDDAVEDSNGDDAVPERDLPRLVELSAHAGNTYSTVTLRFTPGEGQPEVSIEESNDSVLHRPGSGQPVELAGNQALHVTISNASVGDVDPLRPQGPAIAEVRVLGFFEGQTEVGIGLYGTGNVAPKVSSDEAHTVTIAVHNPTDAPEESRKCGDVAFEDNSDAGAFNIRASGVGCELARDVAARAEGQSGDSYDTPSGFACLPERKTAGPIPSIHYTCSRGIATITFITS